MHVYNIYALSLFDYIFDGSQYIRLYFFLISRKCAGRDQLFPDYRGVYLPELSSCINLTDAMFK